MSDGWARIPRRRFHRFVFMFAAVYNFSWGAYAAYDPQWLFRFADLPLQNHPEILACLGMVIALYGILYAEVARAPEKGWLIAAVGLLGKILGPMGFAVLVWTGVWSSKAVVLILTNDVLWWIPFAIYLADAWPQFRRDLRPTG